ncbi:unnamed protein product [Ilex paraguariensis]|uniref:Glycosyltransferase n=1 Tax=Ilex paraguariensis TaxID=185542 RepID=A0ABC8RYD8_9AQUA
MEESPQSLNQTHGHVLVVAFPTQGHVGPLMKLAHQIANHGIKVTFVTTEFVLSKMATSSPEVGGENKQVKLVSVPDGLEPEDDRKDQSKMTQKISEVMPGHLEDLIKKTNQLGSNDKITGVIADNALGWALEISGKMGIKGGLYWCSSPGCLALTNNIPKLIEDKVIGIDGTQLTNKKIQISPIMPAMSTAEFTWHFPGDPIMQKGMFQYIKSLVPYMKSSNWLICNWFHDLDPSACDLNPNVLSIGPLQAAGQIAGSMCSEDFDCLNWLDNQPARSVIYAAFGSTSKFSQNQIDELAMGLELVDRPFLWVAWSGLTDGLSLRYPEGFTERVANRGKMVEWAPQEMVLAHPSIACFLTHCGWNSTMESVSRGVPFLCWPYFGDQLYIQTCIRDAWKVGLSLERDENGIISRHEIKQKLEELLSNAGIRENVVKLKEMARKSVGKGGSSSKNFENLVEQMRG